MKRLSKTEVEFEDVIIKWWNYRETNSLGEPLSNIVQIHYSDGEYSLISTITLSDEEIKKLDEMYKAVTKLSIRLSVKEKEDLNGSI